MSKFQHARIDVIRRMREAFNPNQPRDENGRWGTVGGFDVHASSEQTRDGNRHKLVLLKDGEMVGGATFTIAQDGSSAHIGQTWAGDGKSWTSDQQGKGYGRHVYTAMKQFLVSSGVRNINNEFADRRAVHLSFKTFGGKAEALDENGKYQAVDEKQALAMFDANDGELIVRRSFAESFAVQIATLRESQTKLAATLLHNAHKPHIISIESLILRYQHALIGRFEKECAQLAVKEQNHTTLAVFLNALTFDFQELAREFVPQACDFGFARALKDLQTRGWISKINGEPKANAYIANSILTENAHYLQHSLLAGMHSTLSMDDPKLSGLRARIGSYAHYLWKAAERSYTEMNREFFTKVKITSKTTKVRS